MDKELKEPHPQGKTCLAPTGIRVIYSYREQEKDKDKITLIEIYYKGDKESEDRERIHKYFG